MKNSFTLDDLILSDFCETHNSNGMKKSDLMCLDFNLKQELDHDLSVSPDKRIINNILSYSQALCVLSTKGAGNINMLMN
jgi:hypothetical protein